MSKRVGNLFASRVLQGRSPLYRWLHAHHGEIAAEMATQVRPAWESLAQTARDTGQLDANGNPPNRHSVRMAWKTLERDLNRQPLVQGSAGPPARPAVDPPTRPAAQPAQLIGPDAAAPTLAKPRRVFAVARFKQTPEQKG